MNLLRRGGNSNKTDCRRRRKSLDGTDKNLIILQQDALFYLLSHGFAKFRMINFVYQKSDIRICGRCECLDPPLVSFDIKDIDIGAPQGTCLGLLRFLLYINYLPFALKKAETNMYADDTMISYSSKTLDELHMVLNGELVVIEKWPQGNKLSLNVYDSWL